MSRNPFPYVVRGRRVPSVSEVLRIAGLTDLSGIPEDVLELARQRGQDVHAWVEAMNKGLIDDEIPDPRIAGYIAGYKRFLVEAKATVIESELTVVSPVFGFAGQLDIIAKLEADPIPWLIDVKATAAVPPESALQTAGYMIAKGGRFKRGVLHLRADATFALCAHPNDREDEHDFLAALRIANWKLRHRQAALED